MKLYSCRICNKHFDDGRKLGGHVSRAHKDKSKIEEEWKTDTLCFIWEYKGLRKSSSSAWSLL